MDWEFPLAYGTGRQAAIADDQGDGRALCDGADPMQIEAMWHTPSGAPSGARWWPCSWRDYTIDEALWDIKGKALGR